mgnify:CR=1 FL=1
MLLSIIFWFIIVTVIINIIFNMANVPYYMRDMVREILTVLFVLVLIIYGIYEYIGKHKSHHHINVYPASYLNSLNSLVSKPAKLEYKRWNEDVVLNLEVDMVEEQGKDVPINEIAGGYHEVFNILVPKTELSTIDEQTLMAWTSSNGTVLKVTKITGMDTVIVKVEKSDNVRLIGNVKYRISGAKLPEIYS